MNDFEKALIAEKAREYKIDNQDQFVFDTLTVIQSEKSKRLKRLLMVVIAIIASTVVLFQLSFLQSTSFSGASNALQQILSEKPHYLAMFNLGLIATILFIKRIRIF